VDRAPAWSKDNADGRIVSVSGAHTQKAVEIFPVEFNYF